MKPEWALFDLETDPMELHNEYDNPQYETTIQTLKLKLQALRDQYQETT